MVENHRVWAEINLDAIAHNMRAIRQWVDARAKIMAVVKADGYGHGAIEVAKTALCNGAEFLGVATVEEGVALRQSNIHVPILVFGYTPENKLSLVATHHLIQTIFNWEMAVKLSDISRGMNLVCDVHIKIDTGMSRLGFLPDSKSVLDISKIRDLAGVRMCGIYTHFALSDCDDESFTYEQHAVYARFVSALAEAGISGLLQHVSNSGAVIGCKDLALDCVRTGILLYGLKPAADMDLKGLEIRPAMRFMTQVGYLKELEAGVSVSYGRTYFTKEKTMVATLPVGYADGYARVLSNRGRVLINGVFAPIIGNTCMDQMMVDVTGIDAVAAGDEVVLLGKQGLNEITADELAELQGSISYEVVCGVGKRVPRIYG